MELNPHEFFYSSLGQIYIMMIQDIAGNSLTQLNAYVNPLKELLIEYNKKMSFSINIPYTIYYHPLVYDDYFKDLQAPLIEDIETSVLEDKTVIKKTPKTLTYKLLENFKLFGDNTKNIIIASVKSRKILTNLLNDKLETNAIETMVKEISRMDLAVIGDVSKFVGIIFKAVNGVNENNANNTSMSDQVLEDAFKSMGKFTQPKMSEADFHIKYDYLINEQVLFNSFILQMSKSREIEISDDNVFIKTLEIDQSKYMKNDSTGLWDKLIEVIMALVPTTESVKLSDALTKSREELVNNISNVKDNDHKGKFMELVGVVKNNVMTYFKLKQTQKV